MVDQCYQLPSSRRDDDLRPSETTRQLTGYLSLMAGQPARHILPSGAVSVDWDFVGRCPRANCAYGIVAGDENGLVASATNITKAVSSPLPLLDTCIGVSGGCPSID